MAGPLILHRPRRQLPRYVFVFPPPRARPSPRALSSDLMSAPSIAFRSSRTSRTNPSPEARSLMVQQTVTLNLCVKRRRTSPNPRVTSIRNVMLSCTTSLSEQLSKNYIGHSRTTKSLLHSLLLESSPNLWPVPVFRWISYQILTRYVPHSDVLPCRYLAICIN